MAAPMSQLANKMKMWGIFNLILLFSFSYCFDDEFEGSRTVTLEHSFDQGADPVYTKRGTIAIRSVKTNRAIFSPHSPFTAEDRETLKELVVKDGIYRVRVPLKGSGEDGEYVSSFCKACAVYESSLSDRLVISTDQSGELLGVSIMAGAGCRGIEVPAANLTDWNTLVDIAVSVQGPQPETQSYVEKIKKDESEQAKGQQADNRSFFSKYWMYIVPFVIMMFVMQSMDQGGGGGGR